MPDIAFTTRLTEADWDDALRGWRCPPLAVPGAVIDALFVDGTRIDTAKYEVLAQNAVIRWTPADQPQRAVASVKLTEELTLGKETERWKKLAIVLPVVATVLAATITAFAPVAAKLIWGSSAVPDPPPNPVPKPKVTTNEAPPGQINNTADKALPIKMGESYRVDAGQERWFRMYLDKGPVKVIVRNLYGTGIGWFNVFDRRRVRVVSEVWFVRGSEINFFAPDADTYYFATPVENSGFMEFKVIQ